MPVSSSQKRELDPSRKDEDDHYQQDQSEAAGRVIAPASAMGPGGESTDQEKNKDN